MHYHYEKACSVSSLSRLLDQTELNGVLLAGGTDLLVQLRAGIIAPKATIIDVKGVQELNCIEHHSDGSVSIGATVSMNRIIEDNGLQSKFYALPQACALIATHAVRNRATIAGNIANASPCADSVPALCVLGATVELQSASGSRKLSIPEFIKGVRATVRRKNEFISHIHLPAQPEGSCSLFRKWQRVRGHDLALANAAVMHDPKGGHLVVTIGSCSPVPTVVRLDDVCASFDSEQTLQQAAEQAAERCMKAIMPISDVRASAEYRTDMTGVLVRRLFADLKHCRRSA